MILIGKEVTYQVVEMWGIDRSCMSDRDLGYAIGMFYAKQQDGDRPFIIPLQSEVSPVLVPGDAQVESIPIHKARFEFQYHIHNGERNNR